MSAVSAIIRAIRAANVTGHGGMGRASCKRQVSGSNPLTGSQRYSHLTSVHAHILGPTFCCTPMILLCGLWRLLLACLVALQVLAGRCERALGLLAGCCGWVSR